MDHPPAYTAHRTIHDLRTQIIANGTILQPHYKAHQAADNHIELIVAKAHQASPVGAYGGEKQAVLTRSSTTATTTAGSSSSPVGGGGGSGKHYAVLTHRSYNKQDIRILIKGEPRDSVEEALEWMLEKTERDVHDLVVKYGRAERETCCVM